MTEIKLGGQVDQQVEGHFVSEDLRDFLVYQEIVGLILKEAPDTRLPDFEHISLQASEEHISLKELAARIMDAQSSSK